VLDTFPQHRPDAPPGTTPAIYVRLAGQTLSVRSGALPTETRPLQWRPRSSALFLLSSAGQHGNARVAWISRSQWDLALVQIPAATPDYVDFAGYETV